MNPITLISCVVKAGIISASIILLNTCLLQAANAKTIDEMHAAIPAEVICVKDGDTIYVEAKIWVNQRIKTDVRLRGIDTPEMKSKDKAERKKALDAKNRTIELVGLTSETNICDRTKKGKVYLKNISRDKYGGRVVARIMLENEKDLTDILLAESHGLPYDGKKKKSFSAKHP